ncbi:MAG: BON domain-containing protein [Deltaproteobacteria bacterium]
MKKEKKESRSEILEQLCWDSSVDTKNIKVQEQEGKIRLTGTVPFYINRVSAFRDALNAAHGQPIINDLTVDFPRDVPLPPDEMLEANIRDIVNLLSWVDGEKIKVRVARRLVYLTGQTQFLWQKVRLERTIGDFKGVAGIMNDIEVKPGMDLSDNRIARDLVESLYRINGLDPTNIGVNVINGRVFLEGTVRDSLEMMGVLRTTELTRGVTDVINDLRIQP